MEKNIILQNTANTIIALLGVGVLLHLGSSIIIPFIFALLLAIFLYPIDKKILTFVKKRYLSILMSFLVLLVPIILIFTIFSMQLMTIAESFPSITQSLDNGISEILSYIRQYIPTLPRSTKELAEQDPSAIEGPLKAFGRGLVSTSNVITSLGLCFIYAFFLLYYRRSFKNFIVYQFEKQNRPDIKTTLSTIKETVQSYIGGLGIVILLLSVMNTIGLYLIGVKYAFLWGSLAGVLAIIPYVGTLLGGLLPFLYALATTDTTWQPVMVIVYYLIIQQVEGNLITPKLIGDKVNINPLFAIIAIVFLGTFWGLVGVVLALPMISITRIILSNFETTESLAILMSANIDSKQGVFKRLSEE